MVNICLDEPSSKGKVCRENHLAALALKLQNICQKHLASNNALDFDDLLIRTLRLLRGNEEAREYLSDKFKYILVDEFQDTNAVQYNIVKLLASKHRNLFAVGDDDQSIYGWRGAEIENILRFDKDYPDAKVYKLERNYRSTKSILNLANAIIKNNGARHKKTLWTEAEEGQKPVYFEAEEEAEEALYAARTIASAAAAGEKYSSFAVLMRINALTRSYEQEFTKYGIPYKVFGGFRFFERREIKDILAYLRLISNPFDDEALTRIINVPKRGIGGKTLQAMESYSSQSGLSLYDACLDAEYLPLTAGAKSKIEDFANTIKDFVVYSQSENVAQLVRDIISRTELLAFRKLMQHVFVDSSLLRYIAMIVQETRTSKAVYLGASPRASVAMLQASKAYALLQGRDFVTPEDIKFVAPYVLQHRLILTAEAEMEGYSPVKVTQRLIDRVEVPQ